MSKARELAELDALIEEMYAWANTPEAKRCLEGLNERIANLERKLATALSIREKVASTNIVDLERRLAGAHVANCGCGVCDAGVDSTEYVNPRCATLRDGR